ncbi:type III secretion system translocon subunit SctE, partial [Salmonella enterica subsp. enterica serovar Montevideo]|nr:type III secretion system translocon subunit SctE [Salmonella enterica subsp. enterica serovar Montevideo]
MAKRASIKSASASLAFLINTPSATPPADWAAVMVADEIVKAATGVSFIQQALNPIMEHVLKPLMELIGKAIT